MERIGFVSKDPRLKAELQKWLVEIPGEFEFVDIGPPTTGDQATEGDAVPLLLVADSKYRLVIFDASINQPLAKIRDDLNLRDVPWLAIGLEEHARNPHAPLINGADDLVLVPLDRSVFLQKVEYLFGGSESVTPSFLYLAKADLAIELAKAVHITHISETTCTIRAPRAVARGVEGTLVSKLFGEGLLERVEVRAIESTPCFDPALAGGSSEPTFEVKLRFFGLRQKQLQELRRWLGSQQPHGLPEITRSNQEPKSVMHVAVISPQSSAAMAIRSSLEDLAKVEIDEFQGFKRFQGTLHIRKNASQMDADADGPPSALPWSKDFIGPKSREESVPALPSPHLVLHIRAATEQVPSAAEVITPPLRNGETLLGATQEVWSREISALTKSLSESDREAFDEAVQWTIANSTLTHHPETQMSLALTVTNAIRAHAIFKISLAEAATPTRAARLKIQIEETPEESKSAKQATTYEAVMVDGSLLTLGLKEKITAVSEWLQIYDVKNSFGNRPPVIVFNAEEERITPDAFRGTPARQLIYNFNDRRFQAELFISLSRKELWTSPLLSVAALKTDLDAFLARPAQATGVSEVSLVITDRSPLKKGTELLVLSPLWSEAPEGLWARLRAVTPKGEGEFANEFIFFGASDLVQKEIRKFAREDYIKKKAQGQS